MAITPLDIVKINLARASSLRRNCPYLELFWSTFFHIWTEYGDSVSLRIQSECWKMRTRKTPNIDTFHAVAVLFIKKTTGNKSLRSISLFYAVITDSKACL